MTAEPRWKKCEERTEVGFEIVAAAEGHPAGITFKPCGVASYLPGDVANRYCGLCHRFIVEVIHKRFYALRSLLPMITLYNTTTLDYPGRYVARLFVTFPQPMPTGYAMVSADVEELRRMLPEGVIRLMRQPGDDPTIMEVWL